MTQLADLQQGQRRRMTYEEFLADPTIEHAEWVDGEVIDMVGVGDLHQRVSGFLFAILRAWVNFNDLGRVFYEPFNFKLGPGMNGRSPDITFVSMAHLTQVRKVHFDGAPNVAIEVISPGSRGTDRGDKYFEYEAAGVREYWLIDPEREVAEFYRLDASGRYELAPIVDGVFRSEEVAGFWVRVDWLWNQPKDRDVERELGID